MEETHGRGPGDPSPAEIARRTAEIRRGWSPEETAKRKGGGLIPETRDERREKQRRRRS
jgi:hypothetical protein